MPKQLRMFPPARPLSAHLGPDFFRSIPKEPGVYLMEDKCGKIVYVGKARNLRNRLSSYRYLSPERASRKSIRLVHSVEKISWELCESDLAAQIRENFLLRTHRPKFNTVNVYPKAHCFIGLRFSNNVLHLSFLRHEAEEVQLFGAFKTGAIFGYAALLRLLWATTRGSFAVSQFPLRMLGTNPPRQFEIEIGQEMASSVASFLGGGSDQLLESIGAFSMASLSNFEATLLQSDTETLKLFFEKTTSRNRLMREQFQVQNPVIAQEELNDFLVRVRHSSGST